MSIIIRDSPPPIGDEIKSDISLDTCNCSATSSIMSWIWSIFLKVTQIFVNFQSFTLIVDCSTYKSFWTAFIASDACFIVVMVAAFVFAPSSASRCISIIESVPSVCLSCFSNRFFRFNALIAALWKKKNKQTKQQHQQKCQRSSFSFENLIYD